MKSTDRKRVAIFFATFLKKTGRVLFTFLSYVFYRKVEVMRNYGSTDGTEPFIISSAGATLEDIAHAVHRYLEKLSCGDQLRRELHTAAAMFYYTQEYNKYLQDPAVARAMATQKEKNGYFLSCLLRPWREGTPYEKIFFAASSIVIFAALCLSYESYILYTKGPTLRTTGEGIAHYCSGGLTDLVTEICSGLPDNTSAVFSLNSAANPNALASYVGPINSNSTSMPGTTEQSVESLFNPIVWKNFWTCSQDGLVFSLEGHAFQGSKAQADEQIVNGRFLVYAAHWLM